MGRKKEPFTPKVTIRFVPFESEAQRLIARENWIISQIAGIKAKEEQEGSTYLHRGIATRAFERRFQLADHVHVTGAVHENGMLHIELKREVPEALKPRQIEITNGSRAIESTAN